ncbi:MAG: hypothetical protein Q9165_000966 [Trypethelium subeluteriae]
MSKDWDCQKVLRLVRNTWPTCGNIFGNDIRGDALGQEGGPTGGTEQNYLTFLANNDSIYTYDIAVGGSTVDENCINTNQPNDLKTQVSNYTEFFSKADMRCTSGKYTTWESNLTLFFVFMSDNDIYQGADTYGDVSGTTAQSKLNCAITSYQTQVKNLYSGGARKFVYISTPYQEVSDRVTGNAKSGFVNTYLGWKHAYDNAASSFWDSFGADTTNFPDVGHIICKSLPSFDQNQQVQLFKYNFTTLMNGLWANPTAPQYKITSDIDPVGPTPYSLSKCTNGTTSSHCIWHNDFHAAYQVHGLLAKDMISGLKTLGYQN